MARLGEEAIQVLELHFQPKMLRLAPDDVAGLDSLMAKHALAPWARVSTRLTGCSSFSRAGRSADLAVSKARRRLESSSSLVVVICRRVSEKTLPDDAMAVGREVMSGWLGVGLVV